MDWIALLWTGIAFVGLGLAVAEWWVAHGDLAYLHEMNYNGRRRIVARGHIRRERFRSGSQLLFALAGIGAMLGWPRVLIISFLMVAAILTVLQTLTDRLDRLKLIDYWRKVDLRHVAERDAAVLENDQRDQAEETLKSTGSDS